MSATCKMEHPVKPADVCCTALCIFRRRAIDVRKLPDSPTWHSTIHSELSARVLGTPSESRRPGVLLIRVGREIALKRFVFKLSVLTRAM